MYTTTIIVTGSLIDGERRIHGYEIYRHGLLTAKMFRRDAISADRAWLNDFTLAIRKFDQLYPKENVPLVLDEEVISTLPEKDKNIASSIYRLFNEDLKNELKSHHNTRRE